MWRKEQDEISYIQAEYNFEALTAAISNAMPRGKHSSKKTVSFTELRKTPILSQELIEDDYEHQLQKALLAEELWIRNDKMRGLPETIIKK